MSSVITYTCRDTDRSVAGITTLHIAICCIVVQITLYICLEETRVVKGVFSGSLILVVLPLVVLALGVGCK